MFKQGDLVRWTDSYGRTRVGNIIEVETGSVMVMTTEGMGTVVNPKFLTKL